MVGNRRYAIKKVFTIEYLVIYPKESNKIEVNLDSKQMISNWRLAYGNY